jgi:hypothetical protein
MPRRRLPQHIKDSPHIRLDVNFCDDDRIRAAGERAAWLYLAMACEARRRRTDGTLPAHVVPRLGVTAWKPRLAALLEVGLITHEADTYRIPAFLKWNHSQYDFERNQHLGRVGGCNTNHPQPCEQPDCMASRTWLSNTPNE